MADMENMGGAAGVARTYWTGPCFVCGRDNPAGLRATVVADDVLALVQLVIPSGFGGLPGVLHGGVVTAALDEAMWYAVFHHKGIPTLTAGITVRFLRPAAPDVPLLAAGWVAGEPGDGRPALQAEARLMDARGKLVAAARGRFAPLAERWARGGGLHIHDIIHAEAAPEPARDRIYDRWPPVAALRRRLLQPEGGSMAGPEWADEGSEPKRP